MRPLFSLECSATRTLELTTVSIDPADQDTTDTFLWPDIAEM